MPKPEGREPREIINKWLSLVDTENHPHIIDIDYQDVTKLISELDNYYKSQESNGYDKDGNPIKYGVS